MAGFYQTHFKGLPLRFAFVAGGTAATERTVPGISQLDSLVFVGATDGSEGDLTEEFAIVDDDKIQNAGGTTTATKVLMVVWNKAHPNGL